MGPASTRLLQGARRLCIWPAVGAIIVWRNRCWTNGLTSLSGLIVDVDLCLMIAAYYNSVGDVVRCILSYHGWTAL